MAYNLPSLPDLSQRVRGFFTQSVPGAIASVWANTFVVFGKVLTLLSFEHEQRRAWLYDQIFASTAAKAWLIRHGFELGLTMQPAAAAAGAIIVPASSGLVVPAGLQFARADGTTFTSVSGATASGATVALFVEADVPGAAGNTDPGFPVTLVDIQDAPAGLGTRALVDDDGLAGGTDAEDVETFRARVLDRKRKPPQGGSTHDYATWAAEALGAGVLRRAYVGSFENDVRSVWLCFTVTNELDGIPTDAQVALVQAYCDDPVRRPVTARVFATAPAPLPVDVVVAGLVPDNLNVRADIEVELAAVFVDAAAVGTAAAPALFSRSWIDEAISRATGESSHDLIAPAKSIVVGAGLLPVLGTVTYAADNAAAA